jgi:hypothetical protein
MSGVTMLFHKKFEQKGLYKDTPAGIFCLCEIGALTGS